MFLYFNCITDPSQYFWATIYQALLYSLLKSGIWTFFPQLPLYYWSHYPQEQRFRNTWEFSPHNQSPMTKHWWSRTAQLFCLDLDQILRHRLYCNALLHDHTEAWTLSRAKNILGFFFSWPVSSTHNFFSWNQILNKSLAQRILI